MLGKRPPLTAMRWAARRFGAPTRRVVGQSVTKVQVIHGEALYATSGHKGLGQQLHAIVERKQPEFKNQGYAANIVKLQEAARPIVSLDGQPR